jgi:hypothetical protein
MTGTARRRLAAAALAMAGALVAVTGRSMIANGATNPATGWGTFAHIATNDLTTTAAKQTVTQNYNLIALRGPLTAALFTDLHGRRSGITLLAYEKAAGLSAADVKAVSASHPEWIAKDRQGNVIHPDSIPDTTLADLTNAGFRAWQAQQMAGEVAMGADGAFIDTLGAYFPTEFYTSKPWINGAVVTDEAWRDGSADLIRRVKAATGKLVIANGFGLGSGNAYAKSPADSDVLIDAADGVQIEQFTRGGDAPVAQFRKANQWEMDMALVQLLGARGKIALAYTKVNDGGTAAELTSLRDYGLGSFLMAFAPGNAYFGFDDGKRIPTVTSDVAWATSLRSATSTKSAAGTNTWSRPFQGGKLTVKVATAPVVTPN